MCRKEDMSSETKEQIALLCNSQKLIRRVLVGVFLHHQALEVQKALLCRQGGETPEEASLSCPDPKMMQVAASVIVLTALFGFQKQGEEIACETVCAGGCADWTEPTLNSIVILIALIRLIRLAEGWSCPEENSSESEGKETEVLSQPVI